MNKSEYNLIYDSVCNYACISTNVLIQMDEISSFLEVITYTEANKHFKCIFILFY